VHCRKPGGANLNANASFAEETGGFPVILDRSSGTEDLSATLDFLLRQRAADNPDGLAVADPGDRPVFTDGVPRRLTWASLDAEADRLACSLQQLGLRQDAVVGLQLPNTVELAIAFFGVLRAGGIAAMLPLAWRRAEIAQALARVGAKAAISMARSGPTQQSEVLCYAAADVFALRFLLAFGRRVPDGVISIDELPVEGALEEVTRSEPSADHVGVITFDAAADGFVPVPRSHRQLVAAAGAHLAATQIKQRDILLTGILGSSLAGLATGLLSALVSGAGLVLHQPFSSRVFAGAVVTEAVTHAVLPGAALAALAQTGRFGARPLRSVTALWRTGEPPQALPPALPKTAHALAFGETALTILPEDAALEEPFAFAEGIEAKRGSDGCLHLRGAMIPQTPLPGGYENTGADYDGWVSTGLPATPRSNLFALESARPGVLRVGGLSFCEGAARALVAEALGCPENAVRTVSDPLFGRQFSTPDQPASAAEAILTEAGISPALFPDRRPEAAAPHARVA